ncbi:MAG: hypothetical protein MJZ60_05465 [Bacteroidaceae bacterium]|nr:hypothetical protein [Bacteroidaceae bacterium]
MNTVKKIRRSFLATAMALGACTLTSCDDDNVVALQLQGEWHGDFGMHYSGKNSYDEVITWECADTYMQFDNAFFATASGYCKQVDYYPDRLQGWGVDRYGSRFTYNSPCPYEYIYHYVNFSIKDGVITFKYKNDKEWNTVIQDYNITSSVFSGHFADTGASFSLKSIKMGEAWWKNYCNEYNYVNDHYYERYRTYVKAEKAHDGFAANEGAKRADGFTLCVTEQGNILVDNPENPSMAVVLRKGVDPESIDLTTMHPGNRHNVAD